MTYAVLLLPAAERDWRKLPREVRPRINRALLALEEEPRPPGVTKLAGSSDRWRIRMGSYCVLYRVDDTARKVTVLRIAHRHRAYR